MTPGASLPATPADGAPIRHAPTVGRLVESLGAVLVVPLQTGVGVDAEITGVTISEPGADEPFDRGDVVLMPGIGMADVPAMIRRVADGGASALVVKWTADPSAEVYDAATERAIAVLGLVHAASWLRVADLVRSILRDQEAWAVGAEQGAPRADDLFAVAETISAIVDGPVTIEDRSSRVLAFSSRQDEADAGRIATVLGRRVPEHWVSELAQRGVFRELATNREPLYVDDLPPGVKPRACVGIWAGNELLGSVWAALDHPLSPSQAVAFRDAANVVALHLMRQRLGQDVDRRMQSDLVMQVLRGGASAAEAAGRLRLSGGPLRVVGAQFVRGVDDASGEWETQRLRDALAMHLGVVHPHAVTVVVDDVVYAVTPVVAADDARRIAAAAEAACARMDATSRPVVAISEVVPSFAQLPRGRRDVDRVLRVLETLQADPSDQRRVAQYNEVRLDSLLLRLSDLLAEDEAGGPLETLAEYDATHDSELVASVAAYFDAFGNVQAAAARLRLHPNTLRYRLRRAVEVGGLDLSDPDARLLAMLLLRAARLRTPRSSA